MTEMSKIFFSRGGGGEISYFIFSYIYEEGKIDITDMEIDNQFFKKNLSS